MKRLVIIGGGFAGTHIAKELEKKFETTLIDTKDYFEFTPGILRALVKPGFERKLQAKHKDYLKRTQIVIGHADIVSNKYVKVGSKKIKYDYLAVCAGSGYETPFKQDNVLIASHTKDLERYHKTIDQSKSIVIVGGGLVGVELAAEIAYFYPNKKVTIIHSKKALVERNPKAAQRYILSYLAERGVWILLNQKAKKVSKNRVSTDRNFTMPADVVLLCTGIKPNSIFFDKHFRHALDNNKNVIVNPHLMVHGTKNVFAAGDITNIYEEKTAQAASKQANIVVKNIIALENKEKLSEYTPRSRPLVISLGPLDGIFVYKKFVYTGLIPGLLKWVIEKMEMGDYT